MNCLIHTAQQSIECHCGKLHPVEQDDGCIVYYQCLPPNIRIDDFLVALWEAGCDPQPVDRS